ncbi:DUF7519 family protein [Natrialba sp. SSL1]|uniref:DUF7519 family protein n=1 Tax=Natrialba sp. SSL1 TaxID=1869245 RepID=UPI0008F843E5|nr:hypothetical protein [Natrialba sp. SSL1]OIB58079.1 hypothetical protein BBD46_10480 [Natrialba sp. SSL1]
MSGLPGDPEASFPTTVSATIALAALLGACFVGAASPIQTAPLLLTGIGLAAFVAGVVLRRRRFRLGGRLLTGLGFLLAVTALVGAIVLSPPIVTLFALLSCGIGALVATLGLFPVSTRIVRPLVRTGSVLVFVGVATIAVVDAPPVWRSAMAVSLVFLSWDTAERAITLGEQVGGTAETVSVELVGAGSGVAVATVAVVLTVAVARLPIPIPIPVPTTGSPLLGLALLLVAVVAFILALTHTPQRPTSTENEGNPE